MDKLEDLIRAEAERLGFAACGFTRADAADDAGLELRQWLEAGHHGTMGWMESRAHHRVSPLALWPEARSAIALGMSYAPAHDPLALADASGPWAHFRLRAGRRLSRRRSRRR